MKSFLKYPGGKQREIEIIKNNLPNNVINYYEPFIGGGSVYLSLNFNGKYYVNDISSSLIKIYEYTKDQNEIFFEQLDIINDNIKNIKSYIESSQDYIYSLYEDYEKNSPNYEYFFHTLLDNLQIYDVVNFKDCLRTSLERKFNLINRLYKKSNGIKKIDVLKNITTGFMSGLYTYYRSKYNELDNNNESELKTALFYYIRDFCYSSMFRYNSNGDFNVPYGGISYDKKDLDMKIAFLRDKNIIEKMKKTRIFNEDFELFLYNNMPYKDDFIFLDPPYDTEFSTYDNHPFSLDDQIRLNNFCKQNEANFMLIIKKTDFILNLYKDFNIKVFNKKYTVSFKNRNNKDVEHLLITNY